MLDKQIRIIIGGGGTGGHIFPAISIADELKRRNSDTEILFVGALGRMEMERVPAAGYTIIGLPVMGVQRKLTLKNFITIFNLFRSLIIAKRIIKDFKPQVVVGVGGYASWPILRSALNIGIPALIQEQNSYAGLSNRLLKNKASRICVAYKGMEKYFPKDKIVVTGNPVRNITVSGELREKGFHYFELKKNKPVLLVIGGSLGARTINESIFENFSVIKNSNLQLIWQTGKNYYQELKGRIDLSTAPDLHIYDFISRMDLAYNVADLVVSRAGAISISELALTGRPAILVPSPNVAEDHQTKNALSLVNEEAAYMVKDSDARKDLIPKILELMNNNELRRVLSSNILKLSKPDSTREIVDEVYKLIRN
jgi:UDP-N-acetylglucosamine--N-acetylmuramyl-(pentapeptide) pyrophosphoryl-undecaprenol N-acetylglucosamine transferase